MAVRARASRLAPRALEFAELRHGGQRRSDGSAFIEHPREVARLLREAGCSEAVVAAGLLHDTVENTATTLVELTSRFGTEVAELVRAVSDDGAGTGYRERKEALREQVRHAGSDAALLFAADKISKVRELPARAVPGVPLGRDQRLRLEHYHESLELLRDVLPRHPLVTRLAHELAGRRRLAPAT